MSILKCIIMETFFLSSWLTSRKNSFPFPGQTDSTWRSRTLRLMVQSFNSVFSVMLFVLIVNITLSEVGKDAHTLRVNS